MTSTNHLSLIFNQINNLKPGKIKSYQVSYKQELESLVDFAKSKNILYEITVDYALMTQVVRHIYHIYGDYCSVSFEFRKRFPYRLSNRKKMYFTVFKGFQDGSTTPYYPGAHLHYRKQYNEHFCKPNVNAFSPTIRNSMSINDDDDIFWEKVRNHYIYKKQRLIDYMDYSEYDFSKYDKVIKKYMDAPITFENICKLDLETLLKIKNDPAHRPYDLWYIIETLVAQFFPLFPPYTKEEIDEMLGDKSKYDIPRDLYHYLTKVSRENLIFRGPPSVIRFADVKEYENYDYSYKLVHKPECGGKCAGLEMPPMYCSYMTETEKRQIDKEIMKRQRDQRWYFRFFGISLGSNLCSDSREKIIVCEKKNAAFGQIIKAEAGDGYSPTTYDKYSDTLKEVIAVKMHLEQNNKEDGSENYSGEIENIYESDDDDDSDNN